MALQFRLAKYYINAIKASMQVLSKHRQHVLSAFIAEQIVPTVNVETLHGNISFYSPGDIPVWRAETLLTKEPETIDWIDGFEDGAVFWDIGANVGCYSLYAAKRNLTVLSFEPSAFNYFILCKNVQINQLDSQIMPLCVAFSDATQLGLLNMTMTTFGGAVSTFADKIDTIRVIGEERNVEFRQGMMGFSIDDYLSQFNPPFPNHVKIDVDGIEDKIIDGASKTLEDERLKTLLVELDDNEEEYRNRVVGRLKNAGFEVMSKKHSEMVDQSAYTSIFNYIFKRS